MESGDASLPEERAYSPQTYSGARLLKIWEYTGRNVGHLPDGLMTLEP